MNRAEAIAWHVGCVAGALITAILLARYAPPTEQRLLKRWTR
jgi:hypothetical protein